jgi:hypothetical protein
MLSSDQTVWFSCFSPSCDETQARPKVMGGGWCATAFQQQQRAGGQQHPAGAVGGRVEQRVRSAAQEATTCENAGAWAEPDILTKARPLDAELSQ